MKAGGSISKGKRVEREMKQILASFERTYGYIPPGGDRMARNIVKSGKNRHRVREK